MYRLIPASCTLIIVFLLRLFFPAHPVSAVQSFHHAPFCSTFSLVAFDTTNGDVGVVVQSKFPNVRPVVPWAKAGVGAIATQSFANVSYGPRGLALMENGATAIEALRILLATDSARDTRQVGIVDVHGNAASWTGKQCTDWAGGRVGLDGGGSIAGGKGEIIAGKYYAAQGNILVGQPTVDSLVSVYRSTHGDLSDKLVGAIVAGGKAGGDRRGEESAALVVKRKGAGYDATNDDYIDISIYDNPHPLKELERLYELHKLYFYRSELKNLLPIDGTICREIQTIMHDRGMYQGPVNGIFDAGTKKALQDFMGWENYDVRIRQDDSIDLQVLEDMRKNFAEWKKVHKDK